MSRFLLRQDRAPRVTGPGDAIGAAGEEGATGGDGAAADRFAGDDGAVRLAVMGLDARPATPEELAQMKKLVEEAMEAGAHGMSSGLEYSPGRHADQYELTELTKVVAPYGGIYASHIRNRGFTFIEATQEALAIGEAAGVPVQLSHFAPRPYAPAGTFDGPEITVATIFAMPASVEDAASHATLGMADGVKRKEKVGDAYVVSTESASGSSYSVHTYVPATEDRALECSVSYIRATGKIENLGAQRAWAEKLCLTAKPKAAPEKLTVSADMIFPLRQDLHRLRGEVSRSMGRPVPQPQPWRAAPAQPQYPQQQAPQQQWRPR